MFCDIRGFTTLSEGMTSEQLGVLINEFLTPMTDIIMAHKGTIDKYIGDCIMAFWNAPLDDPDHAKNAVAAAQDMRLKLVELNAAWRPRAAALACRHRRQHRGVQRRQFRLAPGFNYSLLGDPVNLSSRLEGLTKQYGVDLIIGEDTAALLDDPGLIELDSSRSRARRAQCASSPCRRIRSRASNTWSDTPPSWPPIAGATGTPRWASSKIRACRRTGHGAALWSLPRADRAVEGRSAAVRLGWRVRRAREVAGQEK